MIGNLDLFSRKAGFNAGLRHFRATTSFIGPITQGANLADLLSNALEAGSIERHQLSPIVSSLLVDKFEYAYRSANLHHTIENIDSIADALAEWTAVQVVISYEHPQTGLFVINPKDRESWEEALPLIKDELVVVYVGGAGVELKQDVRNEALDDIASLLVGGSVTTKKAYVRAASARPAPAPVRPARPAPSAAARSGPEPAKGGKKRMTPRYGVVVTNELFHNGNVEAWKRIIQSYRLKNEGLDVLIWYETERINDINALFKWGKVKHGTPIMVSVAGDNIKDVSKLQRYLYEGASPRFEMFLRGSIDQPLDLF